MTIRPEEMSQQELDEYLDQLVDHGEEDTAEFAHAYGIWEQRA